MAAKQTTLIAMTIVAVFVVAALIYFNGQYEPKPPTQLATLANAEAENAENFTDAKNEKIEACPQTCDDNNNFTTDFCSAETSFKCKNPLIDNACGNKICEELNGENHKTCSADCWPMEVAVEQVRTQE